MLPNNWRYLRGDIYYADMEPHIGSEQGGKRPVVVLQNNIGNRHSPTLIVATVTTRTEKKKNQPTHVLGNLAIFRHGQPDKQVPLAILSRSGLEEM